MSTAALTPVPSPESVPRSPQFEADLAALKHTMTTWPETYLVGNLSRLIVGLPAGRRWTRTQRLLEAGVALVLRFFVPVSVTTAAAAWSDAPVWTWLGIVAFLAVGEAVWGISTADPFFERQIVTLPALLERDSDLRELVDFTRRRWRARYYAPAALAIALAMIAVGIAVAPGELRDVHPGSLALIALILYEFGEERAMRSLFFGLYVRESRYAHRLSWLNPAENRSVRALLSFWAKMAVVNGVGLTVSFAFVVILLEPDSVTALLAAIAGFALAALVLDTGSLLRMRSSIRRIVEGTRDASLDRLRRRIDAFEGRIDDLTPQDTQQLKDLVVTYAAVRDAPTGPSGVETLGHALTALAIPAVGFLLAVLTEVYAERLLDQLLP